MGAVLLLVLLTAEAPARQLTPELSAGVGISGTGYTYAGGRWGDALLTPYVAARGLVGPVAGELEVLVTAPLTAGSAATGFTLIPRVGYSGFSWSILLGATLQVAPSSGPIVQALPSLRVRKDFGPFGLALGVFDLHGQAPLHLSAEFKDFDLGYLAPLGGTVGVHFALPWAGLNLQARALAFRLFNADVALFTVGCSWGGVTRQARSAQ